MPNIDDLGGLLNELTGGGGSKRESQIRDFLTRSKNYAYEQALERKKREDELKDKLSTIGTGSNVESSSPEFQSLKDSALGLRGDTERLRSRAKLTPKELLDEYRSMIFDNKPGVLHKINKAMQWLGHDPDKDLPAVMEQYQKNQQRMLEGGKSEEVASKALALENRLRGQQQDTTRLGAEKINTQRIVEIAKLYQNANASGDKLQMQALQNELKLIMGGGVDNAKAAEILTKNAQNPLTMGGVTNSDQQNQAAQILQQQEFSKGLGKNASKWLFERNPGSPGGIGQNGLRYDKDKNASGNTVLTAVPTFGRLPGNPATPATGANVRDRFNQLGGILGNAQLPGIAPQQGGEQMQNPGQPGQTPQPEGVQPQGMQPSRPQPQMQSPQANVSPQNRVVDTFLAKKNGNPLLVTDDDIKKAPQLYSTPIQGEQYIIVKNQTPVNPASQAAAGRFGAPAQITFGQPGETTAAGKTSAEMKSNFISKASDVITALTDAAKEPSKIPGKSVAEATLGGPGTDPKGFISGMFNSDVPNRLPVVSDVAKKIAQLIHTNAFVNKNADQTTSSIAAEFNVLLDLYKNDPKAKEFVTRYTQNISQLLSFYTKSITGSQVNQTELQQFAQVIPNLFMDPQTAMRQLVDFSTKISIGQELKSANYSEDQISRVMKNPTFTQFLQEESNKYASEMVRQGKMTSARPGVVNPPVDKNTLLPVNLLGKFMDKYGPEALGGISVKRRTKMPGQLNPVEKPIVPSTTNKTLDYLRKRNKAYTGVPE